MPFRPSAGLALLSWILVFLTFHLRMDLSGGLSSPYLYFSLHNHLSYRTLQSTSFRYYQICSSDHKCGVRTDQGHWSTSQFLVTLMQCCMWSLALPPPPPDFQALLLSPPFCLAGLCTPNKVWLIGAFTQCSGCIIYATLSVPR